MNQLGDTPEMEQCKQRGHCFHADRLDLVQPPIRVEKCCWCGGERKQSTRDPYGDLREHGPFKAA